MWTQKKESPLYIVIHYKKFQNYIYNFKKNQKHLGSWFLQASIMLGRCHYSPYF